MNSLTKTHIIIFGIVLVSTGCASLGFDEFEEPAPEYEDTELVDRRTPTVAEINQILEDLTYFPEGKGFEYKETDATEDIDLWLEKNGEKMKKMVYYMPEGFILQITGHSDASGPRNAVPYLGKKGNIYYSTERARLVYEAFLAWEIPSEKLTYTGVADDQLLTEYDSKDRRQRRVTFEVITDR